MGGEEEEGEAKKPATQDEKDLLRRTSLVRAATQGEVDAWLTASAANLGQKALAAFTTMSPENQFRVMYDGPMFDCKDSTEVLYARVQRFIDMETQLKKLASADEFRSGKDGKKKKDKGPSDIAIAIGKALVAETPIKEVPEHERRCGGWNAPPEEVLQAADTSKLVGKKIGVGGVIEALANKYDMSKGERVKVTKETKELWKFADDRNVPKTHCNKGWKWILPETEEKKPPKKKAEPEQAAPPKPAEVQKKAEKTETRKVEDKAASKKEAASRISRSRSANRGRSRKKKGRSSSGSSSDRRPKRPAKRRPAASSSSSASGSRDDDWRKSMYAAEKKKKDKSRERASKKKRDRSSRSRDDSRSRDRSRERAAKKKRGRSRSRSKDSRSRSGSRGKRDRKGRRK